MEVVLHALVADLHRVCARIEVADEHSRGIGQPDREAGAHGPDQCLPVGEAGGGHEPQDECTDEDDREPAHAGSYAGGPSSDWAVRSSAPKRSASSRTMRSRSPAASSSDSVRSEDWKASAIAMDFLRAGTCLQEVHRDRARL